MANVIHLDDDVAQLALISHWLRTLGHTVTCFTRADEALAAFSAGPKTFDFVLTDMSMPLMSGLEFGQQILSLEPGALVIIATGCETPNWADFARSSGVRVIEKPKSVEEMAEVLDRLLSTKALSG